MSSASFRAQGKDTAHVVESLLRGQAWCVHCAWRGGKHAVQELTRCSVQREVIASYSQEFESVLRRAEADCLITWL